MQLIGMSVLLMFVAACHADLTERVTINGDGSAVVTFREALDDELYRFSRETVTGMDPFGIALLTSQGWTTSREIEGVNSHVLIASRTCARRDITVCLQRLPFVGRARWAEPLATTSSVRRLDGGLLNNRVVVDLTLGPYGIPSSSGDGFDLLRKALSAAAPSVLEIHFELALPGTVLTTNGEQTADGAIRWDVNFAEATHVVAEYSVLNWQRVRLVGLAVAIAVSVILSLSLVMRRKRF